MTNLKRDNISWYSYLINTIPEVKEMFISEYKSSNDFMTFLYKLNVKRFINLSELEAKEIMKEALK